MKPLIPADAETQALRVLPSSLAFSLVEKFSWLGTPASVMSLINTVDGWLAKAHAGTMNSTADLSLYFGGLSGDYPHVHQNLMETVSYIKTHKLSLDRRELLSDYVVMGVRGLTAYVMGREKDMTSVYNYNGPMNTLKHLSFVVGNGPEPRHGNGAAVAMLDEVVCNELSPLLKRIICRQAQDGYAHHYSYLLDVVGSICMADGQYTPAFKQAACDAFKEVFGAFDEPERTYLLHELDSLHFSDEMKALIHGLADDVTGQEQAHPKHPRALKGAGREPAFIE